MKEKMKMTVKVTDFKRDLFRVLFSVLPKEFTLKDSEDIIDEKKTPMACVSTDSGTQYSLSEYGQIQGKTSVKIDLYLSMGKTLKNNIKTESGRINIYENSTDSQGKCPC